MRAIKAVDTMVAKVTYFFSISATSRLRRELDGYPLLRATWYDVLNNTLPLTCTIGGDVSSSFHKLSTKIFLKVSSSISLAKWRHFSIRPQTDQKQISYCIETRYSYSVPSPRGGVSQTRCVTGIGG